MLDLRTDPDLVETDALGNLTGDDSGRLVPELERLAADPGPAGPSGGTTRGLGALFRQS